MMRKPALLPILTTLVIGLPRLAIAGPVEFVRDIRPLLERHCYGCHGPQKQRSGLRLDIRSEAFRGGDVHGPAVVPGKPENSPLVQFVSGKIADRRMPPKGEPLSPSEVALLARWIREGADWPKGADRAVLEDRRAHWSFRPLAVSMPPMTANRHWSRNSIDQFILARLERESFSPAPEADRLTWLRRVSFDLAGLPPTPDEVDAFQADSTPGAYARVVDRILASPRYGERWAQHWLDVVRYADTHGFEVNTERPNAWPYRDYVIRAFNRDTPYDEFIREQIAGDAFGEDAATGFLVTASVLLPGQIGKDAPSIRLARQDSLDEIVNNTTQTFLGLSVGCARCHDHKFDPISQADYYGMQAFFAGVEYGDRPLRTPEADAARLEAASLRSRLEEIERELARLEPLAQSGNRRPSVNARRNTDRFAPVRASRLRFTILSTNKLEPCIDELEVFDTAGTNIALATAGTTVASAGDKTVTGRHELRFLNDGRYGNSASWMSDKDGRGSVTLDFSRTQIIDCVLWGRDRDGKFTDRLTLKYRIEVTEDGAIWRTVADASDREEYAQDIKHSEQETLDGLSSSDADRANRLVAEKRAIEARLLTAGRNQLVFAGTFRRPDTIHLLNRGDPEQPGSVVAPSVPSFLADLKLPEQSAEQHRRLALAAWIASPENPLTARVMVNRIWQGHFGTGLVSTPSDFGRSGSTPSHPDLLDWLAGEFIRSGWSVKHMHRLIVLSATYRQSARVDPAIKAKDASSRLLGRFPSRRLEAEAVRDSMLVVSGQLNPRIGGSGFNLFDKRGGLTGFIPVESFGEDGRRRMIYAHRVRRERDAVFGAFDCPDFGQSTPRRRESTTPLQALNLFNSLFTYEASTALAGRVRAEAGGDIPSQIRHAYKLALGRYPDREESADAAPVVREHGLSVLCRALFNTNEFLFLP